jgi:hypothetical protein
MIGDWTGAVPDFLVFQTFLAIIIRSFSAIYGLYYELRQG